MKRNSESGPYPIPSVVFAKMSKLMIGLIVFLDLDILFLVITIPSLENAKNIHFETQDILIFTIFFVFLALANYLFIIRPFFRKEYIELNESSIKVKLIFKKEKIYKWDKIKSAEVVVGYRGWRFLKITGLEPTDELFSKTTSILIPLELKFANISEERLLHTIYKMKAMEPFRTQ